MQIQTDADQKIENKILLILQMPIRKKYFNLFPATMANDQRKELLTQDEVLATSENLEINLTHCDEQCPEDAIKIQFVEKGREGFMERFATGSKIGGSLYLSQNDQSYHYLTEGDKISQQADIEQAINFWSRYQRRTL